MPNKGLKLSIKSSFWRAECFASPGSHQAKDYKVLRNILLGGPLCSIFCGALLIACHLWIRNIDLVVAQVITLSTGLSSIGIGIVCLIPNSNGIETSDGGRFIRIMRGGYPRKTEMAIWRLTSYVLEEDYISV